MKIVLLVLCLFLILITAVLVSPFLVILSVSDKDIRVKLKVLHITIRIPLGEKEKKEAKKAEKKKEKKAEENSADSVMKKFLEMRNTFTRIRSALEAVCSYLAKKIHIQEIGMTGNFGLGNAALTGMSYGMVEAFIGLVVGFLQHFFQFEKPPYRNLQMDYDNLTFELNFAMIMKTKPIYLLKAAWIFRRNWNH